MSLMKLSISIQKGTRELEKFDEAAVTVTKRVREIDQARVARRSEGLDALLDGPATGAVMSLYIEMLKRNPNDPGLSQLKNFLRQFSSVDESVFTQIEVLMKKAHREKNRERSQRGNALGDDVVKQILDDVRGL